jgi:uncharacterized membrane protein
MLFILAFIVLTLALPLSVEIYKKGSDNVVSRSGKELAETKPVSQLIDLSGRALSTLSDFAKGSLALGMVGVSFFLLWKFLSFLLRLVF